MPQLDFPWERGIIQALRENKHPSMPDNLSLSEQAAFQAVSCLYSRHYLGKIEKEAASREKKLIKHKFKARQKANESEKALADYHIELTRKTEIHRAAFRKAATPEEALEAARKLVEAIDNVPAPPKWSEADHAEEKENQSAS